MYAQLHYAELDGGGGNGAATGLNGKTYPHGIPGLPSDAEMPAQEWDWDEDAAAPSGLKRFLDMLAGRSSLALYRSQFELMRADTDQLRDLIYQLRYQVYAHEHGFEDPSDFPDGREFDAHDDRALHILLRHRRSGIYVGTARLVLPQAGATSNNFPVQSVSSHPIFHDAEVVRHAGEFSRLAISRERLKRCRIGAVWPGLSGNSGLREGRLARAMSRALLQQLSAGLIAGVVELAAESGLPVMFAAMEPQLIRRLGRIGIRFPFVDAGVNYHGLRHPCVLPSLYDACRAMKLHDRKAWEIVTNRGRSQELALAAQTRTKSAWRAVARAYRLADRPTPVPLGRARSATQPQWRAATNIPAITSRSRVGRF